MLNPAVQHKEDEPASLQASASRELHGAKSTEGPATTTRSVAVAWAAPEDQTPTFGDAEGSNGPAAAVNATTTLPVADPVAMPSGHVDREVRVKNAMAHVAVPIFHSAITTAGAASVLCFCQLLLMVKVGIIVATNACVGLIVTFFCLAAMLGAFGPQDFEFLASRYAWAIRGCYFLSGAVV